MTSCAGTPVCRALGACDFGGDPSWRKCTATEESCPTSLGCKMFGHCRLAESRCGGDHYDGGCRGAACKAGGLCGADSRDGTCYPTPAACKKASVCKRAGLCTSDEWDAHSTPVRCDATTKGCEDSEVCAIFGRCALERGACVATDCAASKVCREHGACTLAGGRCVRTAPSEGACELEEVTGLLASASTAQKTWKEYTFGAENLVDRDLGTSWQPEKGKGVGARAEIRLPVARRVAAVRIANGFQRRDGLGDLQAQNGMLGHALVRLTNDVYEVADLAYDRDPKRSYFGYSEVRLPPTETTTVTLEALSVIGGLVFDDLAVSEVRVFACRQGDTLR